MKKPISRLKYNYGGNINNGFDKKNYNLTAFNNDKPPQTLKIC